MSDPAETIDTETGEILSPPVSLVHHKPKQSLSATRMIDAGVRQLSEMSEEDFRRRIETMKLGKQRMREVQRSLLDEGTDYGIIPGTQKKTLFKSGAEKLAEFYQFAISHEVIRTIGDGVATPTIHYLVKSFIHLGSTDGPIIYTGVGSANSWETKYRYRGGGRKCPSCQKEAIIKTKGNARYPAGYWCAPSKEGCGANFNLGDPAIEAQQVGKVENPDPYDQDNTMLKVGKKRSNTDGIIGALAISELFTQDIGDTGAGDHGDNYGEHSAEETQAERDYRQNDHGSHAPVAASTKPPAGNNGSAPATGNKRADAMIEAFKKSTSAAGLDKLGAVIAGWPDAEKELVKELFKKRYVELSANGG